MAITIPRFFPRPWAADELLSPLTPAAMAAGYPSGTSEKPSRQSINKVLQYATNGVLYYLTSGVPAWVSDAQYSVGSIVTFEDRFYCSTIDLNVGQQPDALAGWEKLPWRKSDLDALYMTQAEADERFLTPESGDERFYTQAAANALFLTQANAALEFVTKAALEEHYLTTEQAEALFLTEAQADERYVLKGDVVSRELLDETLADFMTGADAVATFMTAEQADERFMTEAEAEATFETQANAQATYLALADAGLRIFRRDDVYDAGAMVLDTTTSIVYQSLRDGNTGNSLFDTVFWQPWLSSIAVDTMLHYIEFTTLGSFTVNASDIPTLESHPEGIHLRIVVKATGGSGGGGAAGAGHGGGEGGMTELVVHGITAAMFPMSVNNTQSIDLRFSQQPGQAQFGIMGGMPQPGTLQIPGTGGAAPNPIGPQALFIVSIVRTPGANGRWGIPGLRGGDGGGVHGGSGLTLGVTPTIANGRRGCGGGGTLNNPAGAIGGPGFVQIYW